MDSSLLFTLALGLREPRQTDTFATFKADFERHEGRPDAVAFMTMDMPRTFPARARKQFPAAEIRFDAFHVSQ